MKKVIFFAAFISLWIILLGITYNANAQTPESKKSITITCKAIKKNGEPCKMMAVTNTGFCQFHNPEFLCEGTKKDGTKCHARKITGSRFCQFHQNQ